MKLNQLTDTKHNIKCNMLGCINVASWALNGMQLRLLCEEHKNGVVYDNIQDNMITEIGNKLEITVIEIIPEIEDNGIDTD